MGEHQHPRAGQQLVGELAVGVARDLEVPLGERPRRPGERGVAGVGRLHPRRELRADRPRLGVGLVEQDTVVSVNWSHRQQATDGRGGCRCRSDGNPARILCVDGIDRQIVALLVEDGRRTYDDIGRHVALSAPAVKRRVDRLRRDGAIRGFTAVVDHSALGEHTEALIELFFAPGTQLETVADTLARRPEVLDAWSVTGEADAIARVRTSDNADLERLIRELQHDGQVVRTRSQVVLSQLVRRERRAGGQHRAGGVVAGDPADAAAAAGAGAAQPDVAIARSRLPSGRPRLAVSANGQRRSRWKM